MSRLAAWLMKCRTPQSPRPRLGFVTLEDRITPANFVVSNTLDAGAGSLRAAVIAANGAAGADTITFTTGGAITLITGEIAISGPLTITGNGNAVSGNNNSRIFNTDTAPTDTIITINAFNINSGKAADGGAVFIGDETVSFNDCSFSNNSSTDDGGAINVQTGGTLNLNRCIVSGNTAASNGGGIYFFQNGDGTIANTSIVNNKATATGGGFYFFGTVTTGAALKFQNATISGNSSGSSGGGIFLTNFTGALTVQNSTITNNTAAINSGGGIIRNSGSGTISIDSSIVSGNVNAAAPDISSGGTVTINNSAYGSATGFTPTGSNNLVGQNLKLAPLADNGGQFGSGLLTHAFDAASPLINKGSNVAGLSTDARGNARQVGTAADIGAVELQSIVTTTSDAGNGSLREAVLDSNRFPGTNIVSFDPTVFNAAKTITLGSVLSITDPVTINGPAQPLTIDGNNATQLFSINIATANSTVTMKNLTLTKGKSTAQGGAIRVEDEGLILDNVTISNSTAASSGGGIFLNTSGSLALTNSTISGNSAGTNGGGVYFFQNGFSSINTSTIHNNKANGKGGGLYFFGTASTFAFNATTISGNTAGTSGGGIDLVSFSIASPGTFYDCTIVNNAVVSGNGGGIARESGSGSIDLTSTIVSGNSATANVDISGGMTVGGGSNAVGSTTGFTPLFSGVNLLNQPHASLKLRALANNGGPTLTHAFEFDSPLRNAGDSLSTTDQRGFARNNGGVDIGAFELNTLVTNTNDSGGGSLRAAVEESNRVIGADTVTFDPAFFNTAKTITLGSTLSISEAVTINGPGARLATVSGDNAVLILNTSNAPAAAAIIVNDLTLANGYHLNDGGAIVVANEALTLNNCAITNNSVDSSGGAISGGFSNPTITINNCIFSGNASLGNGGAIRVYSGNLTINNSTFSGNKSGGSGGAIRGQGTITLRNSTFVGNTSGNSGGGLELSPGSPAVTLESSVVSGNTATTNADFSNGTVNAKNSAIGSNAGFTFNDQGGNLAFGTNLKLRSLANNGGPTQTIAFEHDSPLRNVGSNPNGLIFDQRGINRNNGGVDIGAFELNVLVTNALNTGDGSLRAAIAESNRVVGADTITFDSSFSTAKMIPLITQLEITDAVTITGKGASLTTISGGDATRIISITAPAGAIVNLSGLTLDDGATSEGGAIQAGAQNITLLDMVLSGNRAKVGGAFSTTAANGSLTLNRTVVTNNSSSGAVPGLLIGQSGWAVTVIDSTLSGNTTASGDGAITIVSGSLNIRNSTFSNNNKTTSGFGGTGITFRGTVGAGGFNITNSTLSGNTDGAIDLFQFNGLLTIRNSTITGNSANNGGGIRRTITSTGTISLESTIVSGNTASGSGPDISTTGTVDATASLIGSTAGITTFNGDAQTNSLIGKAANLGPLANNGGLTQTHALLSGSFAINAGSNPTGLTTDQRGSGFPRVVDVIDIGAVEAPFVPSFVVTNANDAGTGSLRQAILNANGFPGADTITFDSAFFSTAKTITLASTLSISEAVTINGPGARLAAVSGNNLVQILSTDPAPAAAQIAISGLTFANAKNANAAAIVFNDETLTITDSAFVNNTATTQSGGAIFGLAGSLVLERTTFSGNSAAGNGGAIALNSSATITIRNSTFANNTTSASGGAISFLGGTHTIQNSTFTNNKATTAGGAIVQNSITTLNLTSSIVSGNTGNFTPDISAGTVNAKNSAIGSSAAFLLNDLGGNIAFGTNLKLAALADNGGPVNTIGFAFDSPLRNAGSNPAGLTTDARGHNRVSGAAIDIGALEMQETVFNTNDSGNGSLREALADSNRFTATNTIIFDPTAFATAKTILLSSELNATDAVTIIGPPTVGVTISGKADLFENFRVLNVATAPAGAAFTLSNMTLTKGRRVSPEQGAGINVGAHTLNLTDVTISNNNVQANGGGIYFSTTGGTLNLTRSTVSNNVATSGAGIHFNLGGSLTILDSTINNNSANDDAGGIFMGGNAPVFNIRNSTISGNSANSDGGGIYLNDFNSTALIRNSTIVGNTAKFGTGGGIKRNGTGTLTIDSTIVSGNTASNGFDIVAASTVNVNFSAIGNSIGFTLTGANNIAFGTNLKLGVLANNGGPTLTHLPASDSPLLNKGSNVASLTTDQRGLTRISGSQADIGSVEVQSAAVVSSVVINDAASQRSRLTKVQVDFASPVTVASLGAISFNRVGGGSVTTSTGLVVTPASGTTSSVTFTFTSGADLNFASLRDGRWTFALPGIGYVSPQFHRLFGDFDGNTTVDATDFSFFPAFGASSNSPFDFNNNSDIDSATDFAQFGNRFGLTL